VLRPLLTCCHLLDNQHPSKRCYCSLYVGLIRPPVADAYPHYSATAPGATGKEGLTRIIDRRYNFVGFAVVILLGCVWVKIQEPQHPLVDNRLCQNLGSGQPADLRYKLRSMKAAPFDQFGDALAPKLPQRSVGRKTARSARPFRIPIDLIARLNIMCQARSAMRRGTSMSMAVSNESVSGVERHIQPLMAIDCPGIR
jgi:hypothetical protein